MKTNRLSAALIVAAVALAAVGVARASTPPGAATDTSPLTVQPQPLDEKGGTVAQDSTIQQPGAIPANEAPGGPGAPGNSTATLIIPPGGSDSGGYVENSPPPAQIGDVLENAKLCFDPDGLDPIDTDCVTTANSAREFVESNVTTGDPINGSVHLVEFTGALYWGDSWHNFDVWCDDDAQAAGTCSTNVAVGPFHVIVDGSDMDGSTAPAWQVIGYINDSTGGRVD